VVNELWRMGLNEAKELRVVWVPARASKVACSITHFLSPQLIGGINRMVARFKRRR
jgi:hypothetical protein